MSSRLVAAKPLRANASVAAVRICSRRCARRMRRTGSGFTSTTTTLPPLLTSECTYTYVDSQVHNPRRALDRCPSQVDGHQIVRDNTPAFGGPPVLILQTSQDDPVVRTVAARVD